MKIERAIFAAALTLTLMAGAGLATPRVDPELNLRLASASNNALFGVILTFQGERLTDDQVARAGALGITTGVRMNNFPIMAVNATPTQIRELLGWNDLRSIYLNSPVQLYLNQTKPLIGVDRLLKDPGLTQRNGGLPVAGKGITIAINDTGVDASHQDLTFMPNDPGNKTIQNVIVNPNDRDGLVIRPDAAGNPVAGITPMTYVENVINSDTNGGHGTHVASIAAGWGTASGGRYSGVAQGASIVGLGSGGGLFILGQIAAFEYAASKQWLYNIRVINCSWGNSAAEVDPDHPINVASRRLVEQNGIVIVFANGNDGASGEGTQNRWASIPWVVTAGASTKEGRLAGFSSRGYFGDAVIRPTILTPGTGGPVEKGFTSDVVAARARTNLTQNGLNADTEIPAAFLPNYTQIGGTSMAAPHLAGVIASILSANPQLQPEDIKALLEKTATPLATYDEFEAGAGLANVHAAVDSVFNPAKPYGNFGFTGKGLTLTKMAGDQIQGSVAPNSSQSHTFNIPANARFTFVRLEWGAAAGEDALVVDNTKLVANDLSLTVNYRDPQKTPATQQAKSDGINLAGLFGQRETVKLELPASGTGTATVRAGLAGAGVLANQPYRIVVTHYLYDSNEAADTASLDEAARLKAFRLIYDRVMGAEAGAFRPEDVLTRMELARALMMGARVMQYVPNRASFSDIAAGSPEQLFAESLKREGIMGVTGTAFGPGAGVTRLEEAVALVRALRMDTEARAKANTNVTYNGQALTDNAEIPGALRGYVQIALDRGLLQAFPAEIKQIGPGQFQAFPGPRFEPARGVKRSEFLSPITRLISELFGE
ncbi:MAG TPA: S8 family serine peptidase [Pyrinomonadaceae bacterium]|jgi:serine protease AprX